MNVLQLKKKKTVFWLCPTFHSKISGSVKANYSQFRGHLENLLVKIQKKNRMVSNKSDICTLDIMAEVH